MRRVVALLAVLLVAGGVSAQITVPPETDTTQADHDQPITHAELALLLLEVVGTKPDREMTPAAALAEVKRIELVPQTWDGNTYLTHGEFSDVLLTLGVHYTPADRDLLASRQFVEAMLRRELLRLRDSMARRMGHGSSLSHILDEGVDRGVVSPMDF
jgi:hypothetical protein